MSNFRNELDGLNFRYDQQLFDEAAQKEFYKLSRNYSRAWAWHRNREKVFPFWERQVEQRRARAIYELVRRFDNSFLLSLKDSDFQDFSQFGELVNAIYFTTGKDDYYQYYQRSIDAGYTVVFGVFNPGSGQTSYRSDIQVELAITRAMRACGRYQRRKEKSLHEYPVLRLVYGIEKNTNVLYMNMIIEI